LETILKIKLPEDVLGALRDGVILCHLANHMRPHSVTSIHVPLPAVVSLFTFALCDRFCHAVPPRAVTFLVCSLQTFLLCAELSEFPQNLEIWENHGLRSGQEISQQIMGNLIYFELSID
jgi:hypothetical protein